jgi:glycerol uptake facilitator-like aquaporin
MNTASHSAFQRVLAEGLGTTLLLAAVVGSGIMAERLASGNMALALLCNSLATGATLFVLISMLAPISGAHFNPAVSGVEALRGNLRPTDALLYIGAQTLGALAGVMLAHAMFDLPLFQVSDTPRTGPSQWLSEAVATFGLVLTILITAGHSPQNIATSVALYIVAAYWFTASTSFANPAVTFARAWTDTFAGIAPHNVAHFVAAQVAGAVAGMGAAALLATNRQP